MKTVEPDIEFIRARARECERNIDDFLRSKNKNNEWYYMGYKEALEWVLTGKVP